PVFVVMQRLVGARRTLVVIRMPLQMNEETVGECLGSVPRVAMGYTLVAAPLQASSRKTVVLDIVDGLEKRECHPALCYVEDCGQRPPGKPESAEQEYRQGREPEHLVPPGPEAKPMPPQALGFQPPSAQPAARERAQVEGVEGLAEARRSRVIGRRDAHVVAPVVLDEKVSVAHRGEQYLRQQLVDLGAGVAELVREGDPLRPGDKAH